MISRSSVQHQPPPPPLPSRHHKKHKCVKSEVPTGKPPLPMYTHRVIVDGSQAYQCTPFGWSLQFFSVCNLIFVRLFCVCNGRKFLAEEYHLQNLKGSRDGITKHCAQWASLEVVVSYPDNQTCQASDRGTEFRWESAPYHVPPCDFCCCWSRNSVGSSCVRRCDSVWTRNGNLQGSP